MSTKLLVRKFIITLIFVSFCKVASSENVTADKTISSDSTTQQVFTADDITLTISSNATLSRSQKPIVTDNRSDVTVTINEGSEVFTTSGDNAIVGKSSTNLTVNNSGKIYSSGAKAVSFRQGSGATLSNNSGATIYAATNTISGNHNDTENATITNSGTIYSTDASTNTIIFGVGSTGNSIVNNAGGEIYTEGTGATIKLGASSTLTNSGTIKTGSVSSRAINAAGSNNTITLKDDGKIIGIISSASGTTGNKLQMQHGFGQGYFYETSGDFTLEDLDGNQVVKGSAGSVGQGGSETLDELLGYKSLNIRKSLNRYKKSKSFLEGDDSWGEAYVSNLKRKENTNNLAIGYDHKTFGINLINPLQSSHFMLSLEHSKQDLLQEHSITRYSLLTGLYFPQLKNLGKFETENFVSAGITLNDSERTILTNTTTSGILNVTDTYETYEVIAGKKFKYFDNLSNINMIPDIGITVGYSLTPSHSESKYFIWDKKHVANLTASLSDEYSIQISENTNLSAGWIGDFRRLITEQKQKYEINNTKATFSPGNELKNEITFAGNIGLKHNFSKHGLISFNLDGSHSTQDTNNITGYIAMEIKF